MRRAPQATLSSKPYQALLCSWYSSGRDVKNGRLLSFMRMIENRRNAHRFFIWRRTKRTARNQCARQPFSRMRSGKATFENLARKCASLMPRDNPCASSILVVYFLAGQNRLSALDDHDIGRQIVTGGVKVGFVPCRRSAVATIVGKNGPTTRSVASIISQLFFPPLQASARRFSWVSLFIQSGTGEPKTKFPCCYWVVCGRLHNIRSPQQ